MRKLYFFCCLLILLIFPQALYSCAGKAELSASMPEKSSVNISLQQMFDDYDYLWKVLDENYPYFNVALRAGVDMYSIRDEYRIKLNSLRTGQQFYSFMLSLSHKLNGQDAIGHLKMLEYSEYNDCLEVYENIDGGEYLAGIIDNPVSRRNYQIFAGKEAEHGLFGEQKRVQANSGLQLRTIVKEKIAYVKIPSFELRYIKDDGERLMDFYRSIASYSNLIIDIRGNQGGSSIYYTENILKPLLPGNVAYRADEYMLLKNGLESAGYLQSLNLSGKIKPLENLPEFKNLSKNDLEDLSYFVYDNSLLFRPSNKKPLYSNKIWLLVDEHCYSAAESFALTAKKNNFATLVGTRTGGDGIGFDPLMTALPNSGIIFRYSCQYGINPDGACNEEFGTFPDVPAESGGDALNICLERILSARAE